MNAEYSVVFLNESGDPIDLISDFISLDYSRTVNELGRLSIILPEEGVDVGQIRRDSHILVYRKPTGRPATLDMNTWWIVDHVDWNLDERTVTIDAGDLLHLLKRRIVGYTSQTSYADKTFVQHGFDNGGPDNGFFLSADDMMKEYVYENLAGGVLTPERQIEALSIQEDVDIGPDVEESAAWKPLISTLQDIVSMSANVGRYFYFDIVPLGNKKFEFRVYENLIGVDRTIDGKQPSLFHVDNLSGIHLRWDYRDEKTHIYASGEGGGSGVLYLQLGDTSRDISLWGRIEDYINLGSEASSASFITQKMREALYKSRGRIYLEAQVIEESGSEYGIDYGYGDLVTATIEGYTFNSIVDTVSVSVREGEEVIRSSVAGEIIL